MYPVGTREREGETRNGGDDHCSLQFIVSLFIAILDLTACNIMDVSQQMNFNYSSSQKLFRKARWGMRKNPGLGVRSRFVSQFCHH